MQCFLSSGPLGHDLQLATMAAHAVSKLWSCGSFKEGIEHVAGASADLTPEQLEQELQEPAVLSFVCAW